MYYKAMGEKFDWPEGREKAEAFAIKKADELDVTVSVYVGSDTSSKPDMCIAIASPHGGLQVAY